MLRSGLNRAAFGANGIAALGSIAGMVGSTARQTAHGWTTSCFIREPCSQPSGRALTIGESSGQAALALDMPIADKRPTTARKASSMWRARAMKGI